MPPLKGEVASGGPRKPDDGGVPPSQRKACGRTDPLVTARADTRRDSSPFRGAKPGLPQPLAANVGGGPPQFYAQRYGYSFTAVE